MSDRPATRCLRDYLLSLIRLQMMWCSPYNVEVWSPMSERKSERHWQARQFSTRPKLLSEALFYRDPEETRPDCDEAHSQQQYIFPLYDTIMDIIFNSKVLLLLRLVLEQMPGEGQASKAIYSQLNANWRFLLHGVLIPVSMDIRPTGEWVHRELQWMCTTRDFLSKEENFFLFHCLHPKTAPLLLVHVLIDNLSAQNSLAITNHIEGMEYSPWTNPSICLLNVPD